MTWSSPMTSTRSFNERWSKMAESTEKRSRYWAGGNWAAPRHRVDAPRHSAFGRADTRSFRRRERSKCADFFGRRSKAPLRIERRNCELCLRRHGDSPRHHVVRHALWRHHVPGMYQHRRTDVSTVMQEGNDAGIVEVLRARHGCRSARQCARTSCIGSLRRMKHRCPAKAPGKAP